MDEVSLKNKHAWEYRAYEFWHMRDGTPKEKAEKIMQNPKACLKLHQKYFENINGMKIANVCGSNGRKAVPLALLGADIIVFDISEENKRYALELAYHAGVSIEYEVGNFYNIDLDRYGDLFDIVYAEGGILHYFHDIDRFASVLYQIIHKNGKLILNDSHPFRKMIKTEQYKKIIEATYGNYFDCSIFNGDVAYKGFFPKEEQSYFPDCSLRLYTLSEIINSLIHAGFNIKEFNEHPKLDDKKIPGSFTILAVK